MKLIMPDSVASNACPSDRARRY